jgi:lysophospholipase L1-like esterase
MAPLMRRAVFVVAALAVVVLPTGGGSAAGPSALVIGDSLAQGTRPYLAAYLPGWHLRHVVRVGVNTAEGVDRMRSLGGPLPRFVVVSLGTNDDPRLASQFRRLVRTVMGTVGDGRCVVWPNIARPPMRGSSYAAHNRALAAEARSRPNLRVVDWARMTRRHPEWLRVDGVHVKPPGYRARAAALVRALAGCPS